MQTSDTIGFTSPFEFERALLSIKPPSPPDKEDYFFFSKKEAFESLAAFNEAVPQLWENYEEGKRQYEADCKRHAEQVERITTEFRNWCCRQCGLSDLPDDLKQAIYEHAEESRCHDGLAGTFYSMKKIAPLVLEIQKRLESL